MCGKPPTLDLIFLSCVINEKTVIFESIKEFCILDVCIASNLNYQDGVIKSHTTLGSPQECRDKCMEIVGIADSFSFAREDSESTNCWCKKLDIAGAASIPDLDFYNLISYDFGILNCTGK